MKAIPSQIKCTKCSLEFTTDEDLSSHINNKHSTNILNEPSGQECSVIELTCSNCEYVGVSVTDVREHMETHNAFNCSKCIFRTNISEEVSQHQQIVHKTIRVEVHNSDVNATTILLNCTQCEYRCKLNIQLKKHIQSEHPNYECNLCVSKHPEVPFEYKPDSSSVKDMLLLTQQNSAILEEMKKVKEELNLKKSEYSAEKIAEIIKTDITSSGCSDSGGEPRAKRQRKLPSRLEDSVVTARVPIFRNDSSESVMLLRGLVVDVLDTLDAELTERFSEENVSCWGQ